MRRILIVAAALLALAACGDGPTGPGADAAGRVQFTVPGLDGQPAGTFKADGALSLDSIANFTVLGDWAFAELRPGRTAYLAVYASSPAPNGRFHLLMMDIPGDAQAGSVLDTHYDCRPDSGCVSIMFHTNRMKTPPDGDGPRVTCGSLEGAVRITERGGGRIKGTFFFRALCGVNTGDEMFEYNVNDGNFDLPIVQRPR